jgi:hypothetical protein
VHTSALSFSRRSASGATCSFHVHAAAGGTSRDQSGIRPRSPIAVGERTLLPDLSVARDRVAQYSTCRRQLSQLAAAQRLSGNDYAMSSTLIWTGLNRRGRPKTRHPSSVALVRSVYKDTVECKQ